MARRPPHLKPTEKRLLDVLDDGLPHHKRELLGCLWDDQSGVPALKNHLASIRRKLRPMGRTIVLEMINTRCFGYRQVILMPPARGMVTPCGK